MAVRDILRYPHPLLGQASAAVTELGASALETLLSDLVDTLDSSPGVALAAPQIGYSLRAIIVDVSRERRPERRMGHGRVILLNPRVLESSEQQVVREGCLSVPDFTGDVPRFQRVLVEGTEPGGRAVVLESQGYEAIAFQHEIDHLDGLLFLDRLVSRRRDLFPRRTSGRS